MADKKKMSVADILAAARKADSTGEEEDSQVSSDPAPPAAEATSGDAGEDVPAQKPPAQKAAKASGTGERPSVADMLAVARGEKQAPKADTTKKKPAEASPKSSAPGAKTPKTSGAKTSSSEAKDTTSILAATRKPHKPGPMSKAEAKAKAKAEPTKQKAPKPAIPVPPMPEKPAYATPRRPSTQKKVGRRSAMASMLVGSSLAVGFAATTTTLGLWTLALARFMFPNILREPPSQFRVGFPADFSPGQVATKFKAQFGVWVVKGDYNGSPQIYALKSVCTHLGCTPNWLDAEQKFKCPCHGSGFYKDGINFEGPAPRPLERYAIRIADDGQLEIDKSKTFQEEMGQWEDPTSFVPV